MSSDASAQAAGALEDAAAEGDSGLWGTAVDGGPAYSGPVTAATVTVDRATTMGHLGPGFAGFSFEKSHLTDGFFTASDAPLVALFKLLGPGVVRIGANDVDRTTWQPAAAPVDGGATSPTVGTADVDALAGFLNATGWRAIYGLNMKTSTPAAAVAEATYVAGRLGASLAAFEIGNEINFYGSYASVRPQWESFATALHAALPDAPLAGPADLADSSYAATFARDEASEIVLVTHHYYRASATSATASLANLLTADPAVVSTSQALSTAVASNGIRDGFRWGEMNSYSQHGKAGVSDAFGSALWAIDFMLTTARYGAGGVNFHGGGENMDGNTCPSGPSSCSSPFRYSPIDEADGQVTGAAPLFYGMLFVSTAGVGDLVAADAGAGKLSFTAYAIAPGDGSLEIVLVDKDATNAVSARVDTGATVAAASAVYLEGPSLAATAGVTLAGSPVAADGAWAPRPPFALAASGNVVTVLVPPASAVLVRVR